MLGWHLYFSLFYILVGDGMLEFPEFVELIRRYMSVQDFPVHGMFHYFDMDHDGFITVDEFVKSMRCLGKERDRVTFSVFLLVTSC